MSSMDGDKHTDSLKEFGDAKRKIKKSNEESSEVTTRAIDENPEQTSRRESVSYPFQNAASIRNDENPEQTSRRKIVNYPFQNAASIPQSESRSRCGKSVVRPEIKSFEMLQKISKESLNFDSFSGAISQGQNSQYRCKKYISSSSSESETLPFASDSMDNSKQTSQLVADNGICTELKSILSTPSCQDEGGSNVKSSSKQISNTTKLKQEREKEHRIKYKEETINRFFKSIRERIPFPTESNPDGTTHHQTTNFEDYYYPDTESLASTCWKEYVRDDDNSSDVFSVSHPILPSVPLCENDSIELENRVFREKDKSSKSVRGHFVEASDSDDSDCIGGNEKELQKLTSKHVYSESSSEELFKENVYPRSLSNVFNTGRGRGHSKYATRSRYSNYSERSRHGNSANELRQHKTVCKALLQIDKSSKSVRGHFVEASDSDDSDCIGGNEKELQKLTSKHVYSESSSEELFKGNNVYPRSLSNVFNTGRGHSKYATRSRYSNYSEQSRYGNSSNEPRQPKTVCKALLQIDKSSKGVRGHFVEASDSDDSDCIGGNEKELQKLTSKHVYSERASEELFKENNVYPRSLSNVFNTGRGRGHSKYATRSRYSNYSERSRHGNSANELRQHKTVCKALLQMDKSSKSGRGHFVEASDSDDSDCIGGNEKELQKLTSKHVYSERASEELFKENNVYPRSLSNVFNTGRGRGHSKYATRSRYSNYSERSRHGNSANELRQHKTVCKALLQMDKSSKSVRGHFVEASDSDDSDCIGGNEKELQKLTSKHVYSESSSEELFKGNNVYPRSLSNVFNTGRGHSKYATRSRYSNYSEQSRYGNSANEPRQPKTVCKALLQIDKSSKGVRGHFVEASDSDDSDCIGGNEKELQKLTSKHVYSESSSEELFKGNNVYPRSLSNVFNTGRGHSKYATRSRYSNYSEQSRYGNSANEPRQPKTVCKALLQIDKSSKGVRGHFVEASDSDDSDCIGGNEKELQKLTSKHVYSERASEELFKENNVYPRFLSNKFITGGDQGHSKYAICSRSRYRNHSERSRSGNSTNTTRQPTTMCKAELQSLEAFLIRTNISRANERVRPGSVQQSKEMAITEVEPEATTTLNEGRSRSQTDISALADVEDAVTNTPSEKTSCEKE